mmetsp:Transcript_69791/g.215846  ORF Transcript_69791/g.215846 Transcript_69791/m.215846 type:complete len:700 (-) Transcript_69791:1404-3503(-)
MHRQRRTAGAPGTVPSAALLCNGGRRGTLCRAPALAAPLCGGGVVRSSLLAGHRQRGHVLRGAGGRALRRRRHEGPGALAGADERPRGGIQHDLLRAALPRDGAQGAPARLRDHRARDAAADRRLDVSDRRRGLGVGRLHHAVQGHPPGGTAQVRQHGPLDNLLGGRVLGLRLQVECDLARKLCIARQHVLEVVLEVAQDLAQAVPQLPEEGRMPGLHEVLQLDEHRHDVLAHVPLQDAAQHPARRLGARLVAATLCLSILVLTGPLRRETDAHLLAAKQRQTVAQSLSRWLGDGRWQVDLLLSVHKGREERRDDLCAHVELLVVGHEREHEAVDHGAAGGRPLEGELLVAGRALEVGEPGPAVERADDVQEALGEHRGIACVKDPCKDALDEAAHWLGGVAEHVQQAEHDRPSQLDEVLGQQGREGHASLLPQELVGILQETRHVGHEAVDEGGVVDAQVPQGNEDVVPDNEGLAGVQMEDQQLDGLLRQDILLEAELPQGREGLSTGRWLRVHALAVAPDGVGGDRLHLHDDALRDDRDVHEGQLAEREEGAAEGLLVYGPPLHVRADKLAEHGLDGLQERGPPGSPLLGTLGVELLGLPRLLHALDGAHERPDHGGGGREGRQSTAEAVHQLLHPVLRGGGHQVLQHTQNLRPEHALGVGPALVHGRGCEAAETALLATRRGAEENPGVEDEVEAD